MSLQQLPIELLLQVISNLHSQDVASFLQCNSWLYSLGYQDSFWHDLCKLNKINYKHPKMSWKSLFLSNKTTQMCPHLNTAMIHSSSLQYKKDLLWKSIEETAKAVDNHILCLHPTCHFFGVLTSTSHNHNDKHPIVLRLSPLHTLEVWCNSCTKTIGFDGFNINTDNGLISERYIMNEITQSLVSMTEPTYTMIQGRREMEANVYQYQFRNSCMHIVEKKWHTDWIDFISGNSDKIPSKLVNETLLRSDGSLDPKLSLGKDFELIGSLARWYIERIYGVTTHIISFNDLEHLPEYCKLAHSIRIRQHISQATHFSRNIYTSH